ncbi:hypothetical protein DOTSEDRAFT_70631, partial [Dothistroma septosporum NZE10]
MNTADSDDAIHGDMDDSDAWSPVKALSSSIAFAIALVMGTLDRKAGEFLGVPVTTPLGEAPSHDTLTVSAVVVHPQIVDSSKTMAAVDNRLMWHLRDGHQKWHLKSTTSSGQSTPQSRRSPLSLSSYATLANSFLPRARSHRERNTIAADNALIDSLNSSFKPTLS